MSRELPLPLSSYRQVGFSEAQVTFIWNDGLMPFSADAFPVVSHSSSRKSLTDLFLHPHYHGKFTGSGRHLTFYPYVIKGAGLSLLEHKGIVRHENGILTMEEAIREFCLAKALSHKSFVPHYHAIGFYDSERFFIVRDASVPRLAQVNLREIDLESKKRLCKIIEEQMDSSESFDIILKVLKNLLNPLCSNLIHESMNIHNVNLIGQFVDLNSYSSERSSVKLSFWENERGLTGHLFLIKELFGELLVVYNDLFHTKFFLDDVINSALVSRGFNDLEIKILKLFLLTYEQNLMELKETYEFKSSSHRMDYFIPTNFIQTIDQSLKLYPPRELVDQDQMNKFVEELRRHQNV